MKKAYFTILLLAIFFVTGCNYKDVDKRFFVVGIGVDKGEKKELNLTLKLAIPSGDVKTSESNSLLISEEASSITEAVRMIKSKVDKELEFGHAKIIVLGEDIIKKDVKEVVDWFLRRRDIQLISWVAVGSPDANSVLNLAPKYERIPANSLFLAFGEAGTETPYITSTHLFDFAGKLYGNGISARLPIISSEKENHVVNRMVIFKDGKKRMRLNKKETQWINTLDRELKKAEIIVDSENDYFSFNTEHVKTDYQMYFPKKKTPYMEYNIQIKGELEESKYDTKIVEMTKYEQLINHQVEKEVEGVFKKLQKSEVDPLGFGDRYRATHFGKEKTKVEHWQKIYPSMTFKINVKTKIDSMGNVGEILQ